MPQAQTTPDSSTKLEDSSKVQEQPRKTSLFDGIDIFEGYNYATPIKSAPGSFNTKHLARYAGNNARLPGTFTSQAQVDALIGWHQSNLSRNLSFFPRTVSTAVAEFGRFFGRMDVGDFLKDVGAIEGTPTYETWLTGMMDNWESWVNDDLTPVYYRENYGDKSFWGQVGSSEFWGSEVSQGAGFAVGALGPGIVMFSLTGNPTGLVSGISRLGLYSARAGRVLGKLSGLSKTGRFVYNTARKAKSMATGKPFKPVRFVPKELVREIGVGGYSLLQTHSEAVAEASFMGTELREEFAEKIKSFEINPTTGKPWTWEEAEKQIDNAMRRHYHYNIGVLSFSNYVINRMILMPAVLKKGRYAQALRGDKMTKFQKNLNKANLLFKDSMKGIAIEGFYEEGLQTSGEMRTKQMALSGMLEKEGMFETWNKMFKTLGSDYTSMFNTNEGKKAVLLGGLIGSTMGIYSTFKEYSKYNELYDVLVQGRNKNIALALGHLSKGNIFKTNEDGTYVTDSNNNLIFRDELLFLDEQQRQSLLQFVQYLEALPEDQREEYAKEYVIPMLIANYATSDEMLEALKIELDLELGDLMEAYGSVYTKGEILEMAKEFRELHKQTDTIKSKIYSLSYVQNILRDGTDEEKIQVESFINQYVSGAWSSYQVHLRKLMLSKQALEARADADPRTKDLIDDIDKSIQDVKEMLEFIPQASLKDWQKLLIQYMKDDDSAKAFIRQWSTNSSLTSALANPTSNTGDSQDTEEQPPITPETQAVIDFLSANMVVVSSGTQAKTFRTQYKFTDLLGQERIVEPVPNADNTKVQLRDINDNSTEYIYDAERKIIVSAVTNEKVKGKLKLHKAARTQVRETSKNAIKNALSSIETALTNAVKSDSLTQAEAKELLKELKSIIKANSKITPEFYMEIYDLLDQFTNDSAEFFDYIKGLEDIAQSVSEVLRAEMRNFPEIANMESYVYGQPSGALKLINYLEAIKNKLDDNSRWSPESIDFYINKIKQLDSITDFSKMEMLENLKKLFDTIASADILDDQQTKAKFTQTVIDNLVADISDSLNYDDNFGLASTSPQTQEEVSILQQQAKPFIRRASSVFRPGLSEKQILADWRLAKNNNDQQLVRYLEAQLKLLNFYRSDNSDFYRLPAKLIRIQHFAEGLIEKQYGKETAKLLSNHIYFSYMDGNVKKSITYTEFAALDEATATEISNKLENVVNVVLFESRGNKMLFLDKNFNFVDVNTLTSSSDPIIIPQTILMSRDGIRGYEIAEGQTESRYNVINEQNEILTIPAENETEDQRQSRLEQLEAFYTEAEELYDNTIEALNNGVVELTYEFGTSGVLNDAIKVNYRDPNPPSPAKMAEAFGMSLEDFIAKTRIVYASSSKTNVGGKMYNTVAGRAYVYMNKRMFPIFSKKLSTNDVNELFNVLKAWTLQENTGNITFNDLRNYLRSTFNIARRKNAISDTTGKYLSIDQENNGNIAIIYNIGGNQAEQLSIPINAPDVAAEIFKKHEKEIKAALKAQYYNIMYSDKGELTYKSNRHYQKLSVNSKNEVEVTPRTFQEYLEQVFKDRTSVYVDLRNLGPNPRITINPNAQYSTPVKLKPKSKVQLTNDALSDELDNYFTTTNPQALYDLYNLYLDAMPLVQQRFISKLLSLDPDEIEEFRLDRSNYEDVFIEILQEQIEELRAKGVEVDIKISKTRSAFDVLKFAENNLAEVYSIMELHNQNSPESQINDLKGSIIKYVSSLTPGDTSLGLTQC